METSFPSQAISAIFPTARELGVVALHTSGPHHSSTLDQEIKSYQETRCNVRADERRDRGLMRDKTKMSLANGGLMLLLRGPGDGSGGR